MPGSLTPWALFADEVNMAIGTQHAGLTLARKQTERTTGVPATLERESQSDITVLLEGPSSAATHLRDQIQRVAPYFRTALLMGERGCGDEAAVRSLHAQSPLCDRVFLELTAAEAELWLNQENAHASLAAVGMVYLPQPELLGRAEQAALLRLLRARGAQSPRLVAYAEHGLRPLVSTGSFLPELASTLGALRIQLPPLRERSEDIPMLLTGMLQRGLGQHGPQPVPVRLSASLLTAAMKQPWPGNLGQLQAVAQRLLERAQQSPEICTLDALNATDLQLALESLPKPTHDRRAVRMVRLEQVIQEHVRAVLFACGGNKLRAAEILGISRSTLYRMLDAPIPTPTLVDGREERMRLAG
jgi:DNA-binding NtrC family response regulator